MGVRTPAVAMKRRRIITPAQFTAIYDAIPTRQLRLLVETDIETGLRWGELIELRKNDIDWTTGVLTVSRVAGELSGAFTPDGQRFFVKAYPKDTEWRAGTLLTHSADQLGEHVAALRANDLLFSAPQPDGPRRHRPACLPDPDTLGLTEANEKGRQYRHGTLSAYAAGAGRCQYCRPVLGSVARSGIQRCTRLASPSRPVPRPAPRARLLATGW